MKQLVKFAAVTALALVTALSASARDFRHRLEGSGNITVSEIPVSEFHAVKAYRGIDVVLVDSDSDKIVIEADDNLMDKLDIRVVNGELRADFDTKVSGVTISSSHIKVTAPVRGKIDLLRVSSAAEIRGDRVIEGDEVDIYASSAGRIEVALVAHSVDVEISSAATVVLAATVGELDIHATSAADMEADIDAAEVDVEASSAAEITLGGKTWRLEVDASSSADVDALHLESEVCDVEASSGADVEVRCSGELDASASSGAEIDYHGDCTTRISKSGGGSVNHRN